MLRPKTSTCLLCSFRAARKASAQSPIQQVAPLSFKAKQPTRMSLAPSSRVSSGEPSTKPNRRKQDGPFGGMNLKVAGIRGVPERAGVVRKTNEDPRLTNKFKDKRRGRVDRGFKALKMQSALAPLSYEQRSRLKREAQDVESFGQFKLLKSVADSIYTQALQGMVDVKPTPVQKIAIPALLGEGKRRKVRPEKEEFLIAAETGSGKTLSYLIPTINAIKVAEAEDADILEYEKALREEQTRPNFQALVSPPMSEMPHPTTGRPRAIILVPTQELVQQVGDLVKSFGHTVKYRSTMISTAFTSTVIRNRLFSPKGIDILVSTPHLLNSIADSDPNILSRVTHLIIDEADSLMDRGFAPLTSKIIDRATPSLKQLIMCSATIPRSLNKYLQTRFPDINRLVTPNLHAIPRRVQLGVVDVERTPYQGNKDLACADTIWSIGKASADHVGPVEGMTDVKRVLVFVNEREKTLELRDYLVSKGIDAIALSRDTVDERQSDFLASFTDGTPVLTPKADHPGSLADNQPNYVPFGQTLPPVKKSLPNVKVVVATDLGSRGIDTLAVRNVILYDVPHTTIDFIHRLGRTGRMGRRGKGYVLVGKNDRRDIVAEVREGMFMGRALI